MPFKLSEAVVDSLLEKLSSDEEFRTLFQASPRQALASLGHEAAANAKEGDAGVWTCMAAASPLASMEKIGKSRALLRNQFLSAQATYLPIHLQAS